MISSVGRSSWSVAESDNFNLAKASRGGEANCLEALRTAAHGTANGACEILTGRGASSFSSCIDEKTYKVHDGLQHAQELATVIAEIFERFTPCLDDLNDLLGAAGTGR